MQSAEAKSINLQKSKLIEQLQKENAELKVALGGIYHIVATYGKITRGEMSSVLDHTGAGKHIGGPRGEEKEG